MSIPRSAHVLTNTGLKRVDELIPGDLLTSANAQHYPLLSITPTGQQPIHWIRTRGGQEGYASDNHLWKVYNNKNITPEHQRSTWATTLEQEGATDYGHGLYSGRKLTVYLEPFEVPLPTLETRPDVYWFNRGLKKKAIPWEVDQLSPLVAFSLLTGILAGGYNVKVKYTRFSHDVDLQKHYTVMRLFWRCGVPLLYKGGPKTMIYSCPSQKQNKLLYWCGTRKTDSTEFHYSESKNFYERPVVEETVPLGYYEECYDLLTSAPDNLVINSDYLVMRGNSAQT